jgi:hypothetical protein
MTWARETEAGEVAGGVEAAETARSMKVIAAAAKRRIGWQQ